MFSNFLQLWNFGRSLWRDVLNVICSLKKQFVSKSKLRKRVFFFFFYFKISNIVRVDFLFSIYIYAFKCWIPLYLASDIFFGVLSLFLILSHTVVRQRSKLYIFSFVQIVGNCMYQSTSSEMCHIEREEEWERKSEKDEIERDAHCKIFTLYIDQHKHNFIIEINM